MKHLRIIVLLLLTAVMQSCGDFKSPEFVCINSINITEINLKKVTASLNATIYNPNNHKIVINNADIDVLIKDIKVGKLSIGKQNTIAANSNEKCDFIISVSTKDALKSGITAVSDLQKKKIEIKLNGNIDGKYWLFRKNIKIDTTIKP